MPWENVKLNDGRSIPSVGWGSWKMGKGQQAVDSTIQALDAGFVHIDTAQAYLNQEEVGEALKRANFKRSDVFLTTKFSGRDGLSILDAANDSLRKLSVDYVDLYLVHAPSLVRPDILGGWRQMEALQARGIAKSIGVSNFEIKDLEALKGANIVPAVNQILLHPYVWERQKALVQYCQSHGIVVEAYSPLIPVTQQPGGPVDKPLADISKRTNASFDQILLAWARAKGAVVVTNSSKKSRLEGYISAGDLQLSDDDVAAIDAAARKQK
ncbi:Aldo/keto reductase [Exidia glandulosa HHB12029]|uniref:Aldo/keto reductase n=1 Tax=Exidia glandulosa HHB12029 TaxID=1314781 RepID=A0A165CBU2_EXIGL|nr:Aldo/keto reductase [Exidia glandulosa HHB12029]